MKMQIEKNEVVKKQKKNIKKKITIPKTIQESIPYINVYKNGVIEIEENVFSKSYVLEDVNFKIATDEEQQNIFLIYGDLLNTFGPDVKLQITINNRNIDKDDFYTSVLCKMKGDGLDSYREEYNNILTEKLKEGKNNLIHEKYLTVTIEARDIEEANFKFITIDSEISSTIKKITDMETISLTLEERLNILNDIYNLDQSQNNYYTKLNMNIEEDLFNLEKIRKMGLTTKDVIAPTGMVFYTDYFKLGDTYGRVLFMDNLPSFLSTDILPEIYNIPCNMLTSVHYESIAQDKALKIIRNQIVNINSNVVDAQKRASKAGFSADLISPELIRTQKEANNLMEDMTTRNQKLFLVTVGIVHFANTKEDLEKDTVMIQNAGSKHLCQIKKLHFQQEVGLNSLLPLGVNKLSVQRMLTTESACVFIPFEARELSHKNGIYYGLNAISKNMLLLSREKGENANGIILGTSGSGKSFSAKREIINILLNTDDEVYIIDPEREYVPLAKLFNGGIARLAAGSDTHLNPFDMDMHYGDGDDSTKRDNPVTLKSDFICALCDTIMGGRFGITNAQKSIIDRCVIKLYEPYIEKMKQVEDEGITCDESISPTFRDFYDLLLEQDEIEARNIALAIEMYAKGSSDIFSQRTNVNVKSRFVVYDIKDLGTNMMEMGMQITINHIWNKMIENRAKGKKTWFYIDEFYLLTQKESSANFLMKIWKRARKWGGIPTGITQNVQDLLKNEYGRGILSNSNFVMMLKQTPIDRAELAELYHIGQTQLSYITNSGVGQGLIFSCNTIVPFTDRFPTDNSLFKAMTTKA